MSEVTQHLPALTDLVKIGGGGLGSAIMLMIGMRLLGIDLSRASNSKQGRTPLPQNPEGKERRSEVVVNCPAAHAFERVETKLDKLNEAMATANTYLNVIANRAQH